MVQCYLLMGSHNCWVVLTLQQVNSFKKVGFLSISNPGISVYFLYADVNLQL